MKIIRIDRADGGVSIMHVINDVDVDDEIAKWKLSGFATPLGWTEITEGEIPVDRSFRGAWESTGSGIAVNMEKAREIRRGQIGKYRLRETLKAQSGVVDDLAIDNATTPDELKAVSEKKI